MYCASNERDLPNIGESVSPVAEIAVVVLLQVADAALLRLHLMTPGSTATCITTSRTRHRLRAHFLLLLLPVRRRRRLDEHRRKRGTRRVAELLLVFPDRQRRRAERDGVDNLALSVGQILFLFDVVELLGRDQ